MSDRTIELTDGRTLGFCTLGAPEGQALFYFHGTPGSRLELTEDDLVAQIPDLSLVAPDRPGYGLSSPQPGRSLLDWAADVAELADQLELSRFAVAGASGGGPHALACAYQLGDRVSAVLLFASPAPADFPGATRGMAVGNRLGLFFQRRAPWLVRRALRYNARAFAKDPERVLDAMVRQMPAPDRELLIGDSVREAFLRDFHEAYRQGSEGHETDGPLALAGESWGFRLEDIEQPVYLWQGEKDTLVTEAMFRHLASKLPRCEARSVVDAGHLLIERPFVVDQIRELVERGALKGTA